MTALVDLTAGLLMAWAVARTCSPQSITLAVSYLLSLFVAQHYDHENLRPIVTALDAGVVITMAELWKRSGDIQCRIIGTISMAIMAFSVLSAVSGMAWNSYAATANAASFIQIIIVGGFADGFMAWLGRGFDRISRRNNRIFRFVGAL